MAFFSDEEDLFLSLSLFGCTKEEELGDWTASDTAGGMASVARGLSKEGTWSCKRGTTNWN